MRIPANHPMGLHKLYILAILFRISTVIRLGAAFRHVASVILVALLVRTSTASLCRQRIPSILSILGRLSAIWPTTGYVMAGRIGRVSIHPYDLGATTGYYTRAPPEQAGADPGPPSGGRPIHRLLALVGIPEREIPNVVSVRRG